MITPVPLPASHQDLIAADHYAVLTTVMPGGQPQSTPVWFDCAGDYVQINTMVGFQKERNLRRNPKVTLLIYDPQRPLRNLEIRGLVVEMTEVGALEHLNQLTRRYLRRPDAQFFGDSIPAELQEKYRPLKIRIAPTRVRTEG